MNKPLFEKLIYAASKAPSADNMQAWEFSNINEGIDVFLAHNRILPTDCLSMFALIGVGAAIENIALVAHSEGLKPRVSYELGPSNEGKVARIAFSDAGSFMHNRSATMAREVSGKVAGNNEIAQPTNLAHYIHVRATNRNPYKAAPLEPALLNHLAAAATTAADGGDLDAGIWLSTKPESLTAMAKLEGNSTFVRLEHRPLHDEVFEIMRFSKTEVESTRFGLDFATLETPTIIAALSRMLKFRSINEIFSRLGLGRLVAKLLATRLQHCGALCLVTARSRNSEGYIKAGRAMQRIWLQSIAMGLSAQPFGALPQYLTKAELEPDFFGPYSAIINSHRAPFFALFPGAEREYPAIMLRLGIATTEPQHRSIRLPLEAVIR